MTTPTPPPSLVIANASGTVVGQVSVAARVSPVKALATAAKGNLVWVGVSVLITAAIIYLETFDNNDANKSIKDWEDAARLLSSGQFGEALAAVVPAESDWDFDDREAFDAFIRKLNMEIEALAAAFENNGATLKEAVAFFNQAVDGMVGLLVPVLIAVIASIALQAFPPTIPLAQAIGIAGMAASVAIVSLTYANIISFFTAVANAVGSNDRYAFTADSRPGWAAVGNDPNIKDITINWVLDASAYKK